MFSISSTMHVSVVWLCVYVLYVAYVAVTIV